MEKKKVLVLAGFFAAMTAVADTLTLGDGSLAIAFRSAEEGLGICGIVNRLEGEVPFVKGSASGADFWRLEFHAKGSDGKIECRTVDNRAPAKARRIEKSEGVWQFVWEGLDLADEKGVLDVTATVRLLGKSASSWELGVRNRSRVWGLFETQYPCLREVVGEGEADVMIPAQYLGERLYRRHTSERFVPPEDINYSWYPMVTAFMKDGAGLYIAPYDGECRIKRLRFGKNHDLSYMTPVENAGVPGRAAEGPRYPVIIAAYRGDWHQAAAIYRKWALRQKWCAKGPIAKRADYPKRMAECHGWLIAEQAAEGVSNFVAKVRRLYPDAKFACEWTKWGNQPFDTNYPEMLPTRKGVPEVMAYGTAVGLPLMPYTNGRLWDAEQASWHYAQRDCTLGENGERNLEKWGRTFGIMCPASRGWQTCFSEYMIRMCEKIQCGLVYIDQVGCSRPKTCFDPAHGHSLGGGTWWVDGNHKIMGRIHDALSARGVPITSEGACECYLDVIDGHELASFPEAEDVPFYTYVYGGYSTYFTTELLRGTAFVPFWVVHARSAIWGVETGMDRGNWQLDSGNERFAAAFVRCVKFREEAKEFLAYGHYTGEVTFDKEPATFHASWPRSREVTLSGEFPEVMGTTWLNADDSKQAVTLANFSDREQTVSFKKPFAASATLPPYSLKLINEP